MYQHEETMTGDKPLDGTRPRSSVEPPAGIKRRHRRFNRVILQADVDVDGNRNLSVEREGADVVIRGHDLGPVVTRAFGPGASEYEWAWRIPAASLPALLAALDGQPGDDPLELERRWSLANPGSDPGRFLKSASVPLEFWNRVGD
jgi:hypothetical protein